MAPRHRRSRAHRRLVVPAALVLATATAAVSSAAWTSTGVGTARATAQSVRQGTAPTPTQVTGGVRLAWAASTLTDGVTAATAYDVYRQAGPTTVLVCSSVTTTSCTDTTPVEAVGEYWVVPRFNSWSGAASGRSAYTYDATVPLTAVGRSAGSDTTWVNAPVTLTFTSTDTGTGLARLRYQLDGTAADHLGAGTGTLTTTRVVSADGTHSVVYGATDVRGNAEVSRTLTVKVDQTLPTTSYSVAGTTVTLTPADATSGVASTQVKIGSANYAPYTGPFTLAAGQTASFYSVDAAGNVGLTGSYTAPAARLDTVAPTTTATLSGTAGTNGWYTSSVSVTLAATDPAPNASGIERVEYSTDGGTTWLTYSTPVPLSAQGTHTVRYRAVDEEGNTETTRALTLTIDSVPPPVPTALILGNNGNGAKDFSATASTDPSGSGFDALYYVISAASSQPTFNASTWTRVDGTSVSSTNNPVKKGQTVFVLQFDQAGNSSAAHATN